MNFFDLHADTPLVLAKHPDRNPAVALTGHGFEAYTQVLAVFLDDACETPVETYRARVRLLRRYLAKNRAALAMPGQPAENRVVLSVENAGFLSGREEMLSELQQDGVRLISLSWNGDNSLAGGCGGNRGLTAAGREVIRRMNDCGMALDVSHLSRKATLEAIDAARLVLASHSCCDAVFPHPRNLTDEALIALCKKGGVIGLCFYPAFLGDGSVFQNLKAQITHLLSLGLEDHIAFGSDFDGAEMADELSETRDVPALYRYLADAGLKKTLLDKIFYQNALAFFDKMCDNK